jgi:hypothetical protein
MVNSVPGVNVKDSPLCLFVWERELNLPVDPAGADEGGVETLYAVGGHDDLDVATRVESVELVEQLQHGALDLTLAARVGIVSEIKKVTMFLRKS